MTERRSFTDLVMMQCFISFNNDNQFLRISSNVRLYRFRVLFLFLLRFLNI